MAANNYAIKFIGTSSDRIDFGTNAKGTTIKDLSTFTIEADIKVDLAATNPEAKAYVERQGVGRNPRLSINPFNDTTLKKGVLRFEFSRRDNKADTNYSYTLPTGYWDDYWHHVAFSVNIGTKEYNIYLDEARVAVGKIPDGGLDGEDVALKVANTTPLDIVVGAGYNGITHRYWSGKIDNIRLWNNVRSESSIYSESHDHITDPASQTSLIEEWKLNEGTGTSTVGSKNATWTASLRRAGALSSALWNIDRPFMGDGSDDETSPTTPTMLAPTNITSDGFTLNWTGSTDNVYVQYYEITIATNNTFTSLVTGYSGLNVGLALTKTITGLTPGTNYYARVRALDAALNASAASSYNSNAAIVTSATGDLTPPNAPVATAASSVTYSSFNANWNASTSSDETGYKLDIATDADFLDILPSYRNLDVGNVLTYAINLGILSSTSYYYRVRAYDAAANESIDSNTISLITAQAPDVTAPNIVVLQPATSVAATSFTANWDDGSDDVGVTGYRVDLSLEEDFSSYVVENLNVGNITAHAFTGLDPTTTYYYRVRAVDAAGNISANNGTPEQVNTGTSTVDQGGEFSTEAVVVQDTYIKQSATGESNGSQDLLYVKGETSNNWDAYFQFDLSGIEGEIINADLRLWVDSFSTVWSTGTAIQVQLVTGTWDEATLTWANNTLVTSGDILEFYPTTAGAFTSVDIGSLLLNGSAVYSLRVRIPTTANKTAIFYSSNHAEEEKRPNIIVTSDPSLATQLDAFSMEANNVSYTNLIKNPSAETGGPTYGGVTGITALTSATLGQVTGGAYDGTYGVSVTTAASIGSGVAYDSPTGLAIAGTGQTVRGCAHIWASTAVTSLEVYLRISYTDATTTTSAAVTVTPVASKWVRHNVSAVATNGKTIDSVRVYVAQTVATSRSFNIDAVMCTVSPYDLVYFDGGTNEDSDWNGTAHASTSTMTLVEIEAEVSYLGDSDENNSVVTTYNEAGSVEMFQFNSSLPTNNRTTKQVTWTAPPVFVINHLFNPSFDYTTTHWDVVGTASTGVRTEEITRDNIGASLGFQSNAANDGYYATDTKIAALGETWNFSAYFNCFDASVRSVTVQIQELSSALAVLQTYAATFNSVADGGWVRASVAATLTDASTKFIRVRILASTAMYLYIDDCQLTKQLLIMPYRSGDSIGGSWSGEASLSETFYRILHDQQYDVNYFFTDSTIIGSNPYSATIITPSNPDDVVTLDTLVLSPESTRINMTFTYLGDDNQSAKFYVQWKRKDLNNWSNVLYSLNRSTRTITAVIPGLKTGTLYEVRVLANDTDDLVYGGTAVTTNEAYLLGEVITLADTSLAGSETTRISFDGFILQGGVQNWVGVTSHDAYSLPDRDVQIEKLARQHGSIELSNYWNRKEISIDGIIKAESRIELEDRLREFRRAMAPAGKQLIIDTFDSKGYYWVATCEQLRINEEAGQNFRHLEWNARFVCADPFRYAPTDTVENLIELTSGEEVMITNDGDLSLSPVFTITTDSASNIYVTLFNETTSERIYATSPVTVGDKLVIDTGKATVIKNGVKIDYEGSFPTLQVGPNTMSTTLTTGTVYLSVQRRHRYF
jgi:phage-related protein